MASGKFNKELIVKEYDYGSATIGSNSSSFVRAQSNNMPPDTYNGANLIGLFVETAYDYIMASVSWANKNIIAYNYYSQAQTVSFKVVALYY